MQHIIAFPIRTVRTVLPSILGFFLTAHLLSGADSTSNQLPPGAQILKPEVKFTPAPLKPSQIPDDDQSVLLGRSAEQAPGGGWGDINPAYEPVEDGGYRISGSLRQFNRPIIRNQTQVITGDAPIFRMSQSNGRGVYTADKIFPLWPNSHAQDGSDDHPVLGTLRLGVPSDGNTDWMDQMKTVTTTFRPGYTIYKVTDPKGTWKAEITVAPAPDVNGMICRVEFDHEVPLVWRFGGLWWLSTDKNSNHVEIHDNTARITEPNLGNGLFLAGCDADAQGHVLTESFGQQVEFTTKPQKVYNLVVVEGVTSYDENLSKLVMARLETPLAKDWPESRDRLKKLWFDCYIQPALNPESHFNELLSSPEKALKATLDWWDARRAEFQIQTPDAHLNSLINWERARSEYHRKGPGLFLGECWQNYAHISTGWYGKEWGGDHEAVDDCLRLYGAKQLDNGAIGWVTPMLAGFMAENNTPYWVDHVWRHYTWTGDKQFLKDLWPAVRKAVSWQLKQNDPDGDGLFRDSYEYWNSDSGGKGPKAPCPSAMSWAMLDRAAKIADVLDDSAAAKEYRGLAELSRKNIFAELWHEDSGHLGAIGSDDIWRGHPETWDEYLAINAGLLTPEQGRRAMRWLESHYGFEPRSGVKLLFCSDWYPLRWSVNWVPTGDTCLAALAGLKSGDVELWWPYIQTAVTAAFKGESPGVELGISNFAAEGGDLEDVDSTDPYLHLAIRGIFGIEPAIQEGRIDICPAFPSTWDAASIRSPDISYAYHREGNKATFKIHTSRPLVKHVRANLTGEEVVTPSETDSEVTVQLGQPALPPEPPKTQPIIMDKDGHRVEHPNPHLTDDQQQRLVYFDLSKAMNKTSEEFMETKFIFDGNGDEYGIDGFWGNPRMELPPTPNILETKNGVRFLIVGRSSDSSTPLPKNLILLSSWHPYPLPGAALIPVGMACKSAWALLTNYVHPSSNYIPNGEIVLHYAGGKDVVTSLVPPFNMDAWFQPFSQEGVEVPYGRFKDNKIGFMDGDVSRSHATALEIPCDPAQTLESIEFRAVCSEGVLGIVGLTVESAH